MNVYPDNVNVYIRLNGVFTDLTQYVIGDISASWGIRDNTSVDRLASTGILKFTLNNESGIFTPDSVSTLSGFKTGEAVKLVIGFEALSYTRFYGKIDVVEINTTLGNIKAVNVTCVDWLDYAIKHPVISPVVTANVKGGDAINTILATMPINPLGKSFDTNSDTFPYVFDAVRTQTNAYNELVRIASSEAGYIYLQKDMVNGEKLVFESSKSRNGLKTPDVVPTYSLDSGRFLMEDGSFFLMEDGTSHYMLNETGAYTYDNNFRDIDTRYGNNIVNRFVATAYPTRMDTTNQVLFKLSAVYPIGAGETKVMRVNYFDSTGGSQISGMNMLAPVATTDYTLNTKSDGTGTDITGNFSVTAVYGSEGVTYTLVNNSSYLGYITSLQARGIGVYSYSRIETSETDTDSINVNGYITKSLEQKYQVDLNSGNRAVRRFLERDRKPRKDVKKVSFLANRDGGLMSSFLALDVGSLIRLKHNVNNIDGYFYIQGIEFTLTQGGILNYTWILRQTFCLAMGLSMIGVEFNGGSTDAINYGYLPQISNLPLRTQSAWIYLHTEPTGLSNFIMSTFMSNSAGQDISIHAGRKLQFYQMHLAGNSGIWNTPDGSIPLNQWVHVVTTHDTSTDSLAVPKIYINGVLQTLTQMQAPIGAIVDEFNTEFVIGNVHSTAYIYNHPFDGVIKDVRIYNRVISAGEVTTLYNAGVPNYNLVTNGLVFQALAVRTDRLSDYINKILSPSTGGIIENIYGEVGKINNNPIGRTY